MTESGNTDWTHFDETGASRMVDVGQKDVTHRVAVAECFVSMQAATLQKILDDQFSKGNVLEVARLAGIMGSKRTADLIPLCHPLGLDSIKIDLTPLPDESMIRIEATASIYAKTGVEMEALTAVSVAALTIYDMCKSIDRAMSVGPIQLLKKSGGASGEFVRGDEKEAGSA